LKAVYGPGTHTSTRDSVRAEGDALVATWVEDSSVNVSDFWGRGQGRSTLYEPRLASLIPEYNRTAAGFLNYRPDAILSPFHPCSILNSISDEQTAINAAIKRDAHVFEFCALAALDNISIRNYLREKLPNYVKITQEQ